MPAAACVRSSRGGRIRGGAPARGLAGQRRRALRVQGVVRVVLGAREEHDVSVAGNHDYHTSGAAGYFDYFGSRAGSRSKGYYSFDVGSWHLISLNSNCSEIGGCGAGSPQESWLRADLAAHDNRCTLAYWHHPRFSSSDHGSSSETAALWRAIYDHRADVVLGSHDHTYKRFAPQDPNGIADASRGIREFVVGTGGKSHYDFPSVERNSEVRNGQTYGVLALRLRAASYSWRFVPEAARSFTDSGSTACH